MQQNEDEKTLNDLIARDMQAVAYCRSCGGRTPIDLHHMRNLHNGTVSLRRLSLKIICLNCGAADCSAIVSAPED
jgi:hypothetical protein